MSKQVLLSGASSGIGAACGKLLLEQGYRITGLCRRKPQDLLKHTAFTHLTVDLADSAQSDQQIKQWLQDKQPDAYIHAAGYGDFGSLEQFSLDQIENAIQVNLTSAMVICRALLPTMRKQRSGQIIFIGSESALQAGRKGVLYSAAKFGLRGIAQALREDCAADGIRVSLVNPGMVRSEFFAQQSFAPGSATENAILPIQVAEAVNTILDSADNMVFDEINLSPRVKSIDFSPHKS